MHMDVLREFTVFSRYLNFTKAASELHMSQPSLSKHIKQLEAEIGFPLISHHGRRLSLTAEGGRFLNGINNMIGVYDATIKDCLKLNQELDVTLNVVQHYYTDEATEAYYSLLHRVHSAYPHISYRYRNPYKQSQLERLADGNTDIAITYADQDISDDRFVFQNLSK